MRRLTVAVSAALCLMGTSSLALAEEGTKYGDQMDRRVSCLKNRLY